MKGTESGGGPSLRAVETPPVGPHPQLRGQNDGLMSVVDGSAPLDVRRAFLQRGRQHNVQAWWLGAAITLVIIWLVAAAVLGIRP